jgi:hypothetical protein
LISNADRDGPLRDYWTVEVEWTAQAVVDLAIERRPGQVPVSEALKRRGLL